VTLQQRRHSALAGMQVNLMTTTGFSVRSSEVRSARRGTLCTMRARFNRASDQDCSAIYHQGLPSGESFLHQE
jgi:hypothetical protein